MNSLELIDNGIVYEGKKMTVLPKKHGKGYVLDVDGRKIKVNDDELVLMYTFFSMMFKTYSKDMKKRSGIYGN
jgi:hypothetical protein